MSQKKPTKNAGPKPVSTSNGPMSVDLLQELVKLMATNDLNTVDLRDGDKRVVLKRGPQMVSAPAYAPAPVAAAPAPAVPAAAPAAAASPAAPADEAGLVPIKSPMVGTFYAKPSPDAKPFVNVGTVINEETDVCVIEAMKVFNNIKAELKGTITKIVAQDGKPVEFGQVLFLVKP
ncbi:MAG: acetyl-CoA carboxylase biotin carboxyl carrier protein [Tepidisphaeraceae bacterium]